ncbi:hypothetical protein APW32_12625 [Staphylococcus aureus]|nr:hypothetical protein APW32_12625 [Staphylococcus aureus]
MKNNKISGFQWAMTIFVFFVITMALSIMLRDFQSIIGVNHAEKVIKDGKVIVDNTLSFKA